MHGLVRGVQLGTHNRSEVAYKQRALALPSMRPTLSVGAASLCTHRHIVAAGSVHREVDAIAYLSPAWNMPALLHRREASARSRPAGTFDSYG